MQKKWLYTDIFVEEGAVYKERPDRILDQSVQFCAKLILYEITSLAEERVLERCLWKRFGLTVCCGYSWSRCQCHLHMSIQMRNLEQFRSVYAMQKASSHSHTSHNLLPFATRW